MLIFMMAKYFSSNYSPLRSISALNILLCSLVAHCGQTSAGYFCSSGQRNLRTTTKFMKYRQIMPLQMLHQIFPIQNFYSSTIKLSFFSSIPKRGHYNNYLTRLSATKKTGVKVLIVSMSISLE